MQTRTQHQLLMQMSTSQPSLNMCNEFAGCHLPACKYRHITDNTGCNPKCIVRFSSDQDAAATM